MTSVNNDCNAFLLLGRDPMRPNSDEDDFLGWVAYASTHVGRYSGLRVYIDVRSPGDRLQANRISCLDSLDELLLHDALQRLWNEWVALGSPRFVLDATDDVDEGFYDRPTIPNMKETA